MTDKQREDLQSILSLVDVKLEQNSKSVNVTIHTYENVRPEKIYEAVDRAIEGLLYADKRLKEEGLKP